MKNSLILIGGGGHCKSCIDVIEVEEKYHIEGILDSPQKVGESVLGYPIIGTDDDIPQYIAKGHSFLVTIGQLKSSERRKKIFQILQVANANIATIISPKALVSKHAQVGQGTIVLHSAIINAGAIIGDNCIINTGCNIEHDVEIGNHCHISTNAIVNGDCKIGNEVFLGSGSVLVNGLTIRDKTIVGAGSTVIHSIADIGIYVGNPATKTKQ